MRDKKHLKDIKREASNYREGYLIQFADKISILGNIKHSRYLRILITIDQQVALHKKNMILQKEERQKRIETDNHSQ